MYAGDEYYGDDVTSPLEMQRQIKIENTDPPYTSTNADAFFDAAYAERVSIHDDEQVRAAIAVLNAYARGELSLDNDILDELETAIDAAFNSSLPDEAEDYDQIY